MPPVALRKESVDRNGGCLPVFLLWGVALRKESVDRNHDLNLDWIIKALSLSARRAWIEITQFVPITTSDVWSLSARRAWIEIRGWLQDQQTGIWSLSARRAWIEIRPC